MKIYVEKKELNKAGFGRDKNQHKTRENNRLWWYIYLQ